MELRDPGDGSIVRSETGCGARAPRAQQPASAGEKRHTHDSRRRLSMTRTETQSLAVTRRRFVLAAPLGAAALAACGAPGDNVAPTAPNTKTFRLLWQVRGNVGDEDLVK